MNAQGVVEVVFSDIDGTLVHYPKEFNEYADVVESRDGVALVRYHGSGEERVCRQLTSMTGGVAYMSEKTVELVAEIRRRGVTFALITGARSSTYKNRRSQLPDVDWEIFENGGRCIHDDKLDTAWSAGFATVLGDGIRSVMEIVPSNLEPPSTRQGVLWDLYRRLEADGWVVDARDYVTNFRVDVAKTAGKSEEDFEEVKSELPALGLTTSFNLGKADIYPADSGKANAAKRVLEMLGINRSQSLAMFDDNNDIELGELAAYSLLPGITHESVRKALEQHPNWRLMSQPGFLGTELALMQVLDMLTQPTATTTTDMVEAEDKSRTQAAPSFATAGRH